MSIRQPSTVNCELPAGGPLLTGGLDMDMLSSGHGLG